MGATITTPALEVFGKTENAKQGVNDVEMIGGDRTTHATARQQDKPSSYVVIAIALKHHEGRTFLSAPTNSTLTNPRITPTLIRLQ